MLKLPEQGGHKEAVLLFTSGSSGEPKGVVLSHRNLLANVSQFGARIDLDPGHAILGCLPLFHSFGSTVTMLWPMLEGLECGDVSVATRCVKARPADPQARRDRYSSPPPLSSAATCAR